MTRQILCILFCFVPLFLASCHHIAQPDQNQVVQPNSVKTKVEIKTQDTLAYVWHAYDNGDTVGKGFHSHQTLQYPEFKNEKMLNDTIKAKIVELDGWIDSTDNVKKTAQVIIKDTTHDENDADEIQQSSDLQVLIVAKYHNLFVINFSQDQSGGVHPNHRDTFMNWNIKSHKKIILSDLFIDSYKDQLDEIGEKLFRKDYGLSRKGNMGVYFQNDGFFLTDNFELQPDGINFVYGSYTIAPYMEGYPELLVPYSSIKHLLKPNTIISQFIK